MSDDLGPNAYVNPTLPFNPYPLTRPGDEPDLDRATAVTTSIDILHVRRAWGREWWDPPTPHGPDGWTMVHSERLGSIVVSCAEHDGAEWVHASLAWRDRVPTYEELTLLHRSVWKGRGWAYQVFPPESAHVNIHEFALHLWGRLDGSQALPAFNAMAPWTI